MIIGPEEACSHCLHVARYHTSDPDTADNYGACHYGSNAAEAVFGHRQVVTPDGSVSSDYECPCPAFAPARGKEDPRQLEEAPADGD